jgi:hypothetical protein
MRDPMSADWLLGLGSLLGGNAIIGVGSGAVDLKMALTFGGFLFEFIGLVLGVYPDLSRDWLYRLLGIPRDTRITPGGVVLKSASDPISVSLSGALEMTDSEKIEGLMQKTAALARDVSDLKADNEGLRREWSERLTDARRDIEVTFHQALTAKLEEYRPHRVVGFVVLFIGLALSTIANLLTER